MDKLKYMSIYEYAMIKNLKIQDVYKLIQEGKIRTKEFLGRTLIVV